MQLSACLCHLVAMPYIEVCHCYHEDGSFCHISRSRVLLDKLIIIESKILPFLWNIKEYYSFHSSLPIYRLVSSQMNPAHIVNTCSWSILILSSVHYTTPTVTSSLQTFQPKQCVNTSSFVSALHTLPASASLAWWT